MQTTIVHGDRTTLPVFDWATWSGKLDGPQGTGKIYRAKLSHSEREVWLYESPRGWQRPLSPKYQTDPNTIPPLTKTQNPIPLGRCSCGQYHHCSQCGEQTWHELHGCADGYCTYCHYEG